LRGQSAAKADSRRGSVQFRGLLVNHRALVTSGLTVHMKIHMSGYLALNLRLVSQQEQVAEIPLLLSK
jgi:hypothetical protein